MHPTRRILLGAACATAALAALPARAQQPWPSRPLRLIVPFTPGGGTDIVARALAQKLSQRIGQPVIVENKPGAATVIGTDYVAKAEPDGHTLLVSGSSSFSVNTALRPRLPYDLHRDLAPLAMVARAPLVLSVAASSPWRKLGDLVAAAKAAPGDIHYATFGAGSAPHLAGALLALSAGIQLQDVPYRGSANALMGLLAGELQMTVDTVSATAPQIRAGTLRALAILGPSRSGTLPQVPTMAELGWPDATFDAWYAVAAPGRTPQALQDRLGREIAAAMADPEVKAQLQAQALDPVLLPQAPLRQLVDGEIARYRALAQRARIVVDG